MKKTTFLKTLSVMLTFLLSASAWASQDGDVVLQEQWGRQVITVAADQEITFYDWKGTGSIASSSLNNSRSLTVFKPAAEGQGIQITFESIDVKNDGDGWHGQVLVYSGDPDPLGKFDYSATLNKTSTMPEGTVLDILDGDYTNKTYTTTAADGSLSVGMLWRYAKDCDGWVAKVKCISLDNMEVTGAGSNYEGVGGVLASRQNVVLANAYVTTTGIAKADHVTAIGFTMTQNDDVFNPTTLKLFKDDKQIEATVEADGDDKPEVREAMKNIAMQVAAMSPQYVQRSDISDEAMAKMKEIVIDSSLNEPDTLPKPILQKLLEKAVSEKLWSEEDIKAYEEQKNNKYLFNFLSDAAKATLAAEAMKNKDAYLADKIFGGLVEGRISKQVKEICLFDQVYVKAEDGKQTVKAYVEEVAKKTGTAFAIKSVIRFETGEGIQKKEENFAEEVAKQMNG